MIKAQQTQPVSSQDQDARFFGHEKVYWQDVRTQVHKVNPDLAACIDAVSPDQSLYFYRTRHPFGFNLVRHGYYQLRHPQGETVSIVDPRVPAQLAHDLSFNLHSNPLSLILSGSVELYLEMRKQVVPFALSKQGALISSWRASNPETSQHPPFLWNVSSGARSLFMLPSISENISHKRLCKRLGMHHSKPSGFMDQHALFKAMSESEEGLSPWSCEMLVFTRAWSERLVSDPAFSPLYDYILKANWVHSEHMRHLFIWDCMFSLIMEENNLAPMPTTVDTVKHLFSLAVGARPGFTPAMDDEVGPVHAIQSAYKAHYRLDYAPIMMCPGFFDRTHNDPIYYSFNYPTTPFVSQKKNAKSNTICELNEAEHLMGVMVKEILSGRYRMENIALYDAAKEVKTHFFHANQRAGAKMCSSVLPKLDPRFNPNRHPGLAFPSNSGFWQGAACLTSRDAP
jgi:hypothetical protein